MLRRRGNIWVWIIGIPVILGGIAHWGLYYFVKSRVDTFILEATPRATIHYRELDTSLGGTVTLRGVDIVPAGFEQGLSIGSVQLQGPDAFSFLLKQLPLVGEEGPPDFLQLILKDALVDISGGKAASLDQSWEKANPEFARDRDICKPGGSASFTQLQELGIDELHGDSKMGYRHIAQTRKLFVDVGGELRHIQKTHLSIELNNVPALDSRKLMGVALANMKLDYFIDPEFAHRVSAYCGGKRGLTAEQYSELFADDVIRELNRNGIILGYGLTWALKNYMENWGDLNIELSPPRPVGLLSLVNLPKDELPEKLGLQVAMNGQLVTDLYFSIQDGIPLLQGSKAKPGKKTFKPRIRYRWEYQPVSLGSLSSYLDHKVRIRTADGVVHEGLLISIRGKKISVQKKISGGKFIAHLSPANIRSVMVRVRVKVEPKVSAPQKAVAQQPDSQDAEGATE
ncbi:hypothetical protein [Thiolapillus brandeum]|uniref:Uncharacterized protein n=1 Tax=Thiolapillus brandeum TaxID=1076588 RepID=A0A7U6GGR4_9GAMM|nr:hypothetical protein [Thiolapillus brandeum]BAO43290.1 hypothetical protein TBH_C0344 [Thiolapillus brandeum]